MHLRGERVVLSRAPSRLGPFRRRAEAQRAARALRGCGAAELRELADGVPERVRARHAELVDRGHELDAARLRRDMASLERVIGQLRQVERLRLMDACIVAPGLEKGTRDVYVARGGRVVVAHSPAEARRGAASPPGVVEADRLDELLVVASFLAAPPPELRIEVLGSRS
jgi:hypothetical protein